MNILLNFGAVCLPPAFAAWIGGKVQEKTWLEEERKEVVSEKWRGEICSLKKKGPA